MAAESLRLYIGRQPGSVRRKRREKTYMARPTDRVHNASDFELLQRWRAGDRNAGAEVVTRNFALVNRYMGLRVNDDHRLDLVQETFERLVGALPRISEPHNLRLFIIGIARNVVRTYLREHYRQPGYEPVSSSLIDMSGRGPSSILSGKEQARTLLDAWRKLPSEEQELLQLYYVEGLSSSELGDFFAASPAGIRSRLHRVITKLRSKMAEASSPIALSSDPEDDAIFAKQLFELQGKALKEGLT